MGLVVLSYYYSYQWHLSLTSYLMPTINIGKVCFDIQYQAITNK